MQHDVTHLKYLLAATAVWSAPLLVLLVSFVVRKATQVCTRIGRIIAAYVMPAAAPNKMEMSKHASKET
jgi:hypothetical protein